MSAKKMYGTLTYLKDLDEDVMGELRSRLNDLEIVESKTATAEDISRVSGNFISTRFACYAEENELYQTIIFRFDLDEESASSIVSGMLAPILFQLGGDLL